MFDVEFNKDIGKYLENNNYYTISNDRLTMAAATMLDTLMGGVHNDRKIMIDFSGGHFVQTIWDVLSDQNFSRSNETVIWFGNVSSGDYSFITDYMNAVGQSNTVYEKYMEQEGFKIINNITWQKTNPPPNLACRCFTHSTETILWAQKDEKKSRHFFNYKLMKEQNGGKQMKDVWTGSLTKKSEKAEGKHPTQKPEYLLERIIFASTEEGQVIMDPFCGSGTTGVEAVKYGRKFVGIDNCEEYLQITERRLEKVTNDK